LIERHERLTKDWKSRGENVSVSNIKNLLDFSVIQNSEGEYYLVRAHQYTMMADGVEFPIISMSYQGAGPDYYPFIVVTIDQANIPEEYNHIHKIVTKVLDSILD
jgi:hypothetical protein